MLRLMTTPPEVEHIGMLSWSEENLRELML
jgi:hypothetical protein